MRKWNKKNSTSCKHLFISILIFSNHRIRSDNVVCQNTLNYTNADIQIIWSILMWQTVEDAVRIIIIRQSSWRYETLQYKVSSQPRYPIQFYVEFYVQLMLTKMPAFPIHFSCVHLWYGASPSSQENKSRINRHKSKPEALSPGQTLRPASVVSNNPQSISLFPSAI